MLYVNPVGCAHANRDPPMQVDMIAIGEDKVQAASAYTFDHASKTHRLINNADKPPVE